MQVGPFKNNKNQTITKFLNYFLLFVSCSNGTIHRYVLRVAHFFLSNLFVIFVLHICVVLILRTIMQHTSLNTRIEGGIGVYSPGLTYILTSDGCSF